MHVFRIEAPEQHEKPAVLVGEATIELNGKPVRFMPGQKIVVNRDALPRHQFVRDELRASIQCYIELTRDEIAHGRKPFRAHQFPCCPRRREVEQAEFKLFIEILLDKLPGRISFKPIEEGRVYVRREHLFGEKMRERRARALEHARCVKEWRVWIHWLLSDYGGDRFGYTLSFERTPAPRSALRLLIEAARDSMP